MAFKEFFDELWETKSDKDMAITIRSQAEYVHQVMVEWIGLVQDNSDIEINQEIRDDFVDLLTVIQGCRDDLQQFAVDHPEFMSWKPPKD